MSEREIEQTFLAAIGRRPEDLTLRLVYADWLNERGEDEKAELLRLTVERKRRVLIEGHGYGGTSDRLYFLRTNLDKRWQRRAIEPDIPLETRGERNWLGAVFGGDPERAALGADAPPSLVEDGVLDVDLLWGWPSTVLLRLGLLAARHVVERCASTRATKDGPWPAVRANLDSIEEAWRRGGFRFEEREAIELATYKGLALGKSQRETAINAATMLPYTLRDVLVVPYQALHLPRASATLYVVDGCVRALVALAWSPFGLERAHTAKLAAEAQAKAAATRAETAERELASLPDREEAYGRDASALGLALTLRRDRARDVATSARLAVERVAARCPPAPEPEAEIRALLRAIAPAMVDWIRADPDVGPEPLVTNEVRTILDRSGSATNVRYGPDGRMERVY